MFNVAQLLTSVAADAMSLRRKPHTRALSFLGGGRRSMFGASSLIGLAGLAVGAYQIFKDKSSSPPARQVQPGTTVVGASGQSLGEFGALPLPTGVPLPETQTAAGEISDIPLRAVRLMMAAARCDGQLGEEELHRLMSHARDAGLEQQLRAEWQSPRPLAEICEGIRDQKQQRELYVLAFTVLRADDEVSGAERTFLAQLASKLALSPELAANIERDTARAIDQLG